MNSLRLEDVLGASAGSLRKGITTTRSIHPCHGDYTLPGHSELYTKDPYSKSKKDKIVPAKREATPKAASTFQAAAKDSLDNKRISLASVGKLGDMAEHK